MNTGDINTRHDGEEPQAPRKLVAALKEPPARRVFVPPAMDRSILDAARKHLAARPAHRAGIPGVFWNLRMWPVVASTCLALAGFVYLLTRPETPGFAREDLNRDGQVDVLDAFQLARGLKSGETSAAASDLNGDGVVDGRDAEVIAVRAVKLEKGGRS
jgi:hypothetical protein